MMKKLIAVLIAYGSVAAQPEDAASILQKADEIRAPSESYQMVVSVASSDGSDDYVYQLNIGGKEASLIRTLEPAREVGKNFLMDGDIMWAYIPNIRRSVRVPLNQKLVGQAANGDISRMRWYGDYAAQIESDDEQHWVLLLTANRSGLTYDKLRVWIEKSSYRPVKGQYLSQSGAILKYVEFGNYQSFAGKLRPSEIKIQSAQRSTDYSVLRIKEMTPKSFNSSYFRKANLK